MTRPALTRRALVQIALAYYARAVRPGTPGEPSGVGVLLETLED